MSIEAKQVYEWVKTGHWSKRQFMEWVASTEESSAFQEPVDKEYIKALEDQSYCLLAILERVGEGATVADVLAILEAHPQPKAEPVCPDCNAIVLYECVACSSNNYPKGFVQPKREPLTDEQVRACVTKYCLASVDSWKANAIAVARDIEAAHGIKGEA